MKNILKLKFKAHVLVNYIFYFLIFIVGFVIGTITKKVNINEIISKFLMIDNVSAAEYIASQDSEYYSEIIGELGTPGLTEEYAYKLFKKINNDKNLNLNFNYFQDVIIANRTTNLYQKDYHYCTSFSGSITKPTCTGQYLYINLSTYNNQVSIHYYDDYSKIAYNDMSSSYEYYSSNSNLTGIYETLDFSDYVELPFNKNIFENDENFKKVCVKTGTKIAITNNNFDSLNSVSDYDYIWFPYGLNNLKQSLYDSSVETHITNFTDNVATLNYWFSSKKAIDDIISQPISTEMKLKGYTNLYDYYGYMAYPFTTYYDKENVKFPVFSFVDLSFRFVDKNQKDFNFPEDRFGFIEKEQGEFNFGDDRFISDYDVIEDNLSYCFYINKRFDVYELKENEWGDIYGDDIKFNGDTIDVSSTDNMSKVDSKGLFSKVIFFIDEMRPTINFINNNIYNFYNSLPFLLRLFIISAFSLIMIKLIITMIVK